MLIECDSDKLIVECICMKIGGERGGEDYRFDKKRDGNKLCSLTILFSRLSFERGLVYMAT